jgi:hypothetical protein
MSAPWIVLIVLLWCVVMILIVLTLGLNRTVQQLAATVDAAPQAFAHALDLFAAAPAIGSNLLQLESYRALQASASCEQNGAVIVLMAADCGPCQPLAEALRTRPLPTSTNRDEPQLIIVADPGDADRFRAAGTVVEDRDRRHSTAFGIQATPTAFAIDRNGTLQAVGLPSTTDDIATLQAAARDAKQPPPLVTGGQGTRQTTHAPGV